MNLLNHFRGILRIKPSFLRRTFIGALGASVALVACGTGPTTGGGGGGPNTEQQGSWTDRGVIADGGYNLVFAASSDGKRVAAGITSGHIYTSSDLGKPWIDRSTGDADGLVYWYAFASSADGVNLSAVAQYNTLNKYIFTSVNSGETWNDQTPKSGDASGNLKWQDIASSADGAKLVAVVGPGHIYRSVDSGKTWKDISPTNGPASGNLDWISVYSSDDGQKIAAITSTGRTISSQFFFSENAGGTWYERIVTPVDNKNYALTLHSISGSSDGRTLVTTGLYYTLDLQHGGVKAIEPRVYVSQDYGLMWKDSTPAKLQDTALVSAMMSTGYMRLRSAISSDGTRIAIVVYGDGSPTNIIFTSSTTGKSWFEQQLWTRPSDSSKAGILDCASSADGRVLNFALGEMVGGMSSRFDRWRMISLTFP